MPRDSLKIPKIPINAYSRSLSECGYDNKTLLCIYRDMLFIREFEKSLEDSHVKRSYEGIAFGYDGPAHLCIGQEAVAVGEALCLTTDDLTFGTHRSHGELIARGLRFAEVADLSQIERVVFDSGKHISLALSNEFSDDLRENTRLFTLYGTYSEIFGRKTGFQRGLGGSMHAYFAPFGAYPNNAIVGGSAPLALGAALYKRINDKKGVVVANLGDGAMACGAVYEAMNFASMAQFRSLWQEKRGLPLIFAVTDNVYARGGNTHTETSGMGTPARLGAGVNEDAMHAESVDGFDPLAVADAFARKKCLIEDGKGPVLLNITAYRFSGHSIGDGERYRTRKEVEDKLKLDPVPRFREALVRESIATDDELEDILIYVKTLTKKAFALAVDGTVSPVNDDIRNEDYLDSITAKTDFPSNETYPEKQRVYISTRDEERTSITYRQAIAEAIEDGFAHDNTLLAYGEDVRGYGSESCVFTELDKALPYEKLFNAPIAESSIIGSATGYAMCGGRTLTELLYADFLTRGADELINQLAKWKGLSGGECDLKVTLRLPVGKGYGAQHSQDPVSLIAGVPGLAVIYPATPYDAKGLLYSALTSNAPVVMPESRELYGTRELFRAEGVPNYPYKIKIGEPDVKQTGTDITILTIGGALYRAIEASKLLDGVSVEIIDARTITPFDYDKVLRSVRKTGRFIVAGECTVRASILNDFALHVARECFSSLKAPVRVVGAPDTIIPNSADYYSLTDKIVTAVKDSL